MKQISKLTPAETLVISKGTKASLNSLLKYTFLDLLLKKALTTQEKKQKSATSVKTAINFYIKAGPEFQTYIPHKHELVFLIPFQKSPKIEILFRHLVEMAYENAKSQSSFQNLIWKRPSLAKNFEQGFFQKIFGGFQLSYSGNEARKRIFDELLELNRQLPGLMKSNPDKAFEILSAIKGNVGFLTKVKLNQFDSIKKEFHQKNSNPEFASHIGYDWGGNFDSYSGILNGNWSNPSGCGGTSGCGGSGCSGHGGCGGGGCGGGGCGGGGCGGGGD